MSTQVLKTTNVSAQLQDIRLDITWSKIARRYFGKSASWMYNKLNGIDGNGGEGEFTYAEKQHLKDALYDFSERIRKAADSIEI
ncbi:MAG: DUF5053 domain-containing protein [Bacteroidales bacterium]|jgi:hypothetical protein|nr:DUF5053 domain-containing protein [Bacteroidales bacterium]